FSAQSSSLRIEWKDVLNPQSLLNLSFTLHGRTTRATGGAVRESFPARSGVLPLQSRAFSDRGDCLAEPPTFFALTSRQGHNPFNMPRSHRTKRNDGKPCRDRNGAALEAGGSEMSKTVMIVE